MPLDEFSWIAVLPAVWVADTEPDGTSKAVAGQIVKFWQGVAHDQDRLLNVQASSLQITKKWAWPSNVKEVYVKLFRRDNQAYDVNQIEDVTNILNMNIDEWFKNYRTKDAGYLPSEYILTETDTNGEEQNYIIIKADQTVTVQNLMTVSRSGVYRYWIEEVGYKDSTGNTHFKDETGYAPPFTTGYSVNEGAYKTTMDNAEGKVFSPIINLGMVSDNHYTITNTPTTPPVGTLHIVKTLTGDKDTEDVFSFDVVLKNKDGSFYVGDVTVTDKDHDEDTLTTDSTGKITVSITGEGTATIAFIPAETSYTVTEQDADGWSEVGTVEISGGDANKTIVAGETETVTFTNQPTVDVPVSKVWVFAANSNFTKVEGKEWPDGVTVHVVLYSKTGENDAVLTEYAIDLTDSRPEYTFEKLPKYSGTDLITYSVVEDGVTKINKDQFTVEITGNAAEGFEIHNTEKTTSITVNKQWFYNDAEVEDYSEISTIYFNLYKDSATDAFNGDTPYTITAADEWTRTIEGLPLGTYTVKEVFSDGTEITDGDGVSYKNNGGQTDSTTAIIIKNTLIDHAAVKTWTGDKWPTNVVVEFQLKQNGTDYRDPVTITSATEDHKAVWDKLPRSDYDGTLYVYTVTETVKIGSVTLVQGTDYTAGEWTETTGANPVWTINNELTTVNIPVLKTWANGTPYADAVRFELRTSDDSKVTVDAYGDGITNPVVLSAANNWTDTTSFVKLPKWDSTGAPITYKVVETGVLFGEDTDANWKNPSDYFTVEEPVAYEETGFSITNTPLETEIDVTKIWTLNANDRTDKTSIGFQVYRTGKTDPISPVWTAVGDQAPAETPTPTVHYYAGSGWETVKVTRLPKFDPDGTPYTYYVKETGDAGDTKITYSVVSGEEKEIASEAAIAAGTITIINRDYETTINVLKVEESTRGTTNTPLSNAVFSIKKKGTGGGYADYPSEGNNTQTSGEDGKLAFTNLPDGEYLITEESAPPGYNNADIKIYITIDCGEVTYTDVSGAVIKEPQEYITYTPKSGDIPAEFIVGNTSGVALPSTGGSGTLIYTIAGMALIVLAGVLLVSRRKRRT